MTELELPPEARQVLLAVGDGQVRHNALTGESRDANSRVVTPMVMVLHRRRLIRPGQPIAGSAHSLWELTGAGRTAVQQLRGAVNYVQAVLVGGPMSGWTCACCGHPAPLSRCGNLACPGRCHTVPTSARRLRWRRPPRSRP